MRGKTELRSAFTLIELLVVIAIIAVLMALVSAAVIPMIMKGPETLCRNDMRQLGVSVAAMQKDLQLRSPPPSLLFLSNNRADYFDTSLPYPNLRKESFAYLSKMFPRNSWPTGFSWGVPTQDPAATKGVILEGDQCLVFFLGGPDGINGFSTDPANPVSATDTRKGPYYEFPPGRLKALPSTSSGGVERSATALSFIDGFNSSSTPAPYAFFSSGSRTNGYEMHARVASTDPNYYPDCRGLGIAPFYQAGTNPKRYFNASTIQVVCAGQDGQFGPGGAWNSSSPSLPKQGRDDMSNFHGYRLEVAE